MILPILTPVFVTWNSTPLPVTTVNEPVINAFPIISKVAFGAALLIPTLLPVTVNMLDPTLNSVAAG